MSKATAKIDEMEIAMQHHNELVRSSLYDLQKIAVERFGANLDELTRAPAPATALLEHMRCPIANIICPLAERLLTNAPPKQEDEK